MPNGELNTELLEIPATVYPGMFDRELQATIIFRGREITIIVSHDDVVLERMPPPEDGLVGLLKVHLVDADDRGLLIDLPGEPLGASRRFRVPESEFREAFAGA
jgi:hypothetical protein